MKYKINKQTSTYRNVTLTPTAIHDLQSLRRSSFPRSPSLSAAMLDQIAEREYQKKLYGSYKKSDPTCKICFVKISKNGSCNCP